MKEVSRRAARRSIQIFRNLSIFLERGSRKKRRPVCAVSGGRAFRLNHLAFSFLIASRTLAALAAFGFSAR